MLYLLVLFGVCAIYASLASLVLKNSAKNPLNKVFGALMIVIPLWIIIVFLEDVESMRSLISFLARLDYILASIMLMLFYWFCTLLSKKKWLVINILVAALGSLSFILAATGLLVTPEVTQNFVVLKPHDGYTIFIFLLATTILFGMSKLAWRYEEAKGHERSQLVFVGIGLVLTAVGLIMSLVVAPRLFDISESGITRIGLDTTIFFALFSTYAIVKHHFLDIRLAIARSLAYLMTLTALVTVYILAVFGAISVLFSDTSLNTSQTYIYAILAAFLVFTYQPIKKFFDKITERIFFHNDYDFQTTLDVMGDVTSNEIELNNLTKRSLDVLMSALKTEYICLCIVSNHSGHNFKSFEVGQIPEHTFPASQLREKIYDTVKRTKEPLILASHLSYGSKIAQFMASFDAALIVSLNTSQGLVGFIVFGNKKNGNAFTIKDQRLVSISADELALAVQNSLRFQEIKDLNQNLQKRIEVATSELRDNNRKLRQLDEVKDDFISMASHQLRTPLTSVKGYISMVLDGDAGALKPAQRKLLEESFAASQRMVYLIGDFLNVSRLETGKFVLEKSKVNLANLVAEEVDQLAQSATSRQLKISYDRPAHFPDIVADGNKIHQAVMNFIDNSLYYSPPGDTIKIELTHLSNAVELRVRDHGIGVPKAEQHKLFTKFFRASNARKHRPDGTGIGLFMAKKVVAAHGGAIIFESQEGKGSTFGFRLPIKN